ncbi:MAG: hypothetical protein AB1798_19035 [Spirochaetota bacterium]
MTEKNELMQEDLLDRKKVEANAEKKMLRHRVDDYVSLILGVGFCFIIWLLQLMGFY